MSGRDHSVTCETCGVQRGGLNDYQCDCDVLSSLSRQHLNPDKWPCELSMAMHALAANLAIAGALCAAFALGGLSEQTHVSNGWRRLGWREPVEPWRPGCQRPAPGTPPTASKGAGR